MFIGLTYDVRSAYLAAGWSEEAAGEFDREDTIDAIDSALQSAGHRTERIGHVRQLVRRLAEGKRWDLVFNICEGAFGIAREAQVPALLEAYGIAYTFSDPLTMALCLDKARAKTVVRAAGVPAPDGWVIKDADEIPWHELQPPVFVKPIAEGTGKGVSAESIVNDLQRLPELCRRLHQRFGQPVLLEKFLPGREFTVGIVGTAHQAQVLGTLEIILRPGAEKDVYSFFNKERCEEFVEYRLVTAGDPVVAAAEDIALRAWRALGCRDAGRVDLRCDSQGRPQFLEANPLAGLHPQHSDLPMLCSARGIPYLALIDWIVTSASQRLGETQRQRELLDRLDHPHDMLGIHPAPAHDDLLLPLAHRTDNS